MAGGAAARCCTSSRGLTGLGLVSLLPRPFFFFFFQISTVASAYNVTCDVWSMKIRNFFFFGKRSVKVLDRMTTRIVGSPPPPRVQYALESSSSSAASLLLYRYAQQRDFLIVALLLTLLLLSFTRDSPLSYDLSTFFFYFGGSGWMLPLSLHHNKLLVLIFQIHPIRR